MRILFASKWLRRASGVESSALAAAEGLRREGHEVAWYGFGDGRTDEFPSVGALPREFRLERGTGVAGLARAVDAGVKFFFNPEVDRSFRRTLAEYRPTVVHLHNVVHHLGVRMQLRAREYGVPVVATAHDYHPVCVNYTLLRGERTPCDARCGTEGAWHAVRNRCVRRSRVLSAVSAAEFTLAHKRGAYREAVEHWLTPSEFMRAMLIRGGVAADRVSNIDNCLPDDWTNGATPAHREHVLYLGRLSYEKGVEAVIGVAKLLPDVPVTVAGTGRAEDYLRALGSSSPNLRFLGGVTPEQARKLLASAICLIVPSRWHENSPMVIREAFACGTPVLGTRMGGIPELIDEHVDGWLFAPDDVTAMGQRVRQLAEDRGLRMRMGAAGRRKAQERWSVRRHVHHLSETYRHVVRQAELSPGGRRSSATA